MFMVYIETFIKDSLQINIYCTRKELGFDAAKEVSVKIEEILRTKSEVNIIFASAPSQNEFLEGLLRDDTIEWDKVNAFHMDEYVNLHKDAPQGFGNFIRDRLWGKVPMKSVNYLNGNSEDLETECARYSELIRNHPIDIVCLGIGENGHLAFNDPPVADFNDDKLVKIVELEHRCRQQQVNDGCFKRLNDVPTHALSLTISALMSGKYLYAMVPGKTKTEAVYNTVTNDISTQCPATIMRKHANAKLFTDKDSAALLLKGNKSHA